MPTLTLSRALLRLAGVAPDDLGSVLTNDVVQALRSFLVAHAFDLGRPIHVRELAERQGFHLTQ